MADVIVDRKFGTELTNIKKDALVQRLNPKKTVAAKPLESKSSTKEPQVQAVLRSEETTKLDLNLLEEVDRVLQSSTEESSIEQNHSTPQLSKCRYEKDFLLSFQQKCTAPIPNLLPELHKDYVDPNAPVDIATPVVDRRAFTPNFQLTRRNFKTHQKAISSSLVSAIASPQGGVVLVPRDTLQFKDGKSNTHMFLKHLSKNSAFATKPSNFVDPKEDFQPIGAADIKQMEQNLPSDLLAETNEPEGLEKTATAATPTPSSDEPVQTIHFEWRAKEKKTKPRETDPKRLASRQKQIDIGKNTVGYQTYIATVPKDQRKKGDPKTPDKHQVCSKRSWDGQVRKWRRQLHAYDPPGTTPEPDEDLEDCAASCSDSEEDILVETLAREQVEDILPNKTSKTKKKPIAVNLEKVFASSDVSESS